MGPNISHQLTEPHLKSLARALDQLDGARVLVTGGTGFVGKWLIKVAKIASEVSSSKIEIIVPTRNLDSVQAHQAKAIGFTNLQLVQGDVLTDRLQLGSIDKIIHAATPASAQLNESNPAEMTRVNIEAMRAALGYATNNVPFVFTSSGAVYGRQPQAVVNIPEDQREPYGELNDAYAASKKVAESMCLEAANIGKCSPIIARLFTFSGEYLPLDTHFAIGNFVRNALLSEPIKINSDGKSRRSYMHGSDMATWLWAATAKGSIADPIHVGSERSVSILELAQAVAEVSAHVLDFRPEVIVANPDPSAKNFHQYVPATRKTRALLEVEEWTSLEAGIQQMLEAAQNQH